MRHMFALLTLLLLGAGCATTRPDWEHRIGTYTYDDAVLELGVPDRQAELSDGTLVAEWLRRRGGTYGAITYFPRSRFQSYDLNRFPDRFLRLVFAPDRRLQRVEHTAR